MVIVVNGTSWVGFGWRPKKLTAECRKFPLLQDIGSNVAPEPASEPEPTSEPSSEPASEPSSEPEPKGEPVSEPKSEPSSEPSSEPEPSKKSEPLALGRIMIIFLLLTIT
jgi:hypothetical protein